MPQDAFTLKHIAEELKDLLVGGKISRIVQPSRDLLTFIIYTGKRNVKLEACLSARSARLSLTQSESAVPVTAPNFCMLLRKHLQNAQITDIVQPDFERIIYFDFKCVSDFSSSYMRLYFEIMGKYSNAVLCENGVIIGALKTTELGENTRRVLFGGVKYVPPEPQDKIPPSDICGLEEIMRIPSPDKAKFICERIKGIAYSTARDMVQTYGEGITAQNVYDYVYTIPPSPCITYMNGSPDDFKVRSAAGGESYNSVIEAQTAFYDRLTAERSFADKKAKLENALASAVKKAEKRLASINAKLGECLGAEEVKLKGELITANIYAVERGMTEFYAVNYYDPDCGKIKIELDRALTPSQNAQKYFKRYAKLKRTKISVTEQLAETQLKLDYYSSIRAHICTAESLSDLEETEEELSGLGLLKIRETKKKKSADPPYRVYYKDGFRILAGRSNLQNERLTKSLSPHDMWLHTQKYHSSHVAVITDGREVPDSVLACAAQICAYYSDGRAGTKIPVDYTKKKFVKKPPKSDAGFVIYTDYGTVLVDPDSHTELTGKENE